ncbi:MAG: ATP-binding cassette domain-containing protein [Thermoflexales bacterium]|nr:ATP-binding cassette domain-containing protein [Thermoflexales bacterium]
MSERNHKASEGNGAYKHGNERLIELRQVVKTFETAAGSFTALKGINLQVDRGDFVAVIGKSGSGKSTLINMLTGIDRPSSGEVYVGDVAVHKLSEGKMAQWRGRNVGIVFQFFQLLPTLSLVENVMLPMDFCNVYRARERKERAMHLLGLVDMTDQANKLPSAVSGGQQQRVAIARALATDPPIVVADEPTGNLDSKTAESVFDLFENLVEQGKTILMVTHDQDLAKRVFRAVIVSDGEIIDEYLARAFPSLNDEQLVLATRRLAPQKFRPGAMIIERGQVADRFYIITKGEAEVVLHEPTGAEIVVGHMQAGQYFGEIALLRGGGRTATVRAAPGSPVEVLTLDHQTFNTLLGESEAVRQDLVRTMDERIERAI